MRLEYETNASTLPYVENEVQNQTAPVDVEKMLRDGVKAAQEGHRPEARQLLLGVTDADADNENAWLWLASISEYPEELIVFLNNVLRINPHHERALEWHQATRSLLAKTLVERGADAAHEDRKAFARQCFEQALEQEFENETAWLWLASLADSEEEKVSHFEKVLDINPENETAKAHLAAFEDQQTQQMLAAALRAAFDGRHPDAAAALAALLSRAPAMEEAWILKSHIAESFEERAESFLKLREINPENEMAKANLASWRALSEMLPAPPATEESPAAEEFSQNEPSEISPEFSQNEISEFSPAEQPAAAENESPAARFDEPIEANFEASGEMPADNFTGENFEAEDFAAPDSPTQELQAAAGFASESAPPNADADLQNDEPRFASHESQEDAPLNLAETTEAEEAEMHWAFSGNSAGEENPFEFAQTDDIHQTQQANYTAEDFAEEIEAGDDQAAAENQFAAPDENRSETAPEEAAPESFEHYAPSMPEYSFEEQPAELAAEWAAPPEETPAATVTAENYAEAASESLAESAPESGIEFEQPKAEPILCPFCNAENERQAFSCVSCRTILTLSDLEMLIGQNSADQETLHKTVESLERENESYGLSAEQLMHLGIGHLNLKHYRQGYLYLQEAVRMNPSNVILDAQVNSLAIRLSEMEAQQSIHDSMAKNRKILVVDDSPTVRKLISGKLEKCGHEVICAVDGIDALEKITEMTPDLILLDITMPRKDGYQVCKEIRTNEATKDVPVVMISGKDGFFDKVRGRMAGTTGYITKPFGPETLMKTVESYLN